MVQKEGGVVKILHISCVITYPSTPLIEGPGSAPAWPLVFSQDGFYNVGNYESSHPVLTCRSGVGCLAAVLFLQQLQEYPWLGLSAFTAAA